MTTEMRETYWSRFTDSFDADQEYVVGKELLDEIDRQLDRLPHLGEVVELGCGSGRFTGTIAAKATNLVATDLSGSLLEVARRRLGDRPGITFREEDCTATSFPPESLDAVFVANLLHVIESPARALEECHRILRRGGTLVVVSYTGHGTPLLERIKLGVRFLRRWGKPPPHVHWFSPEGLGTMMEEAGFRVETSRLLGERTKALYAVGRKD